MAAYEVVIRRYESMEEATNPKAGVAVPSRRVMAWTQEGLEWILKGTCAELDAVWAEYQSGVQS